MTPDQETIEAERARRRAALLADRQPAEDTGPGTPELGQLYIPDVVIRGNLGSGSAWGELRPRY